MSTSLHSELVAKWVARLDLFSRFRARLDGVTVCQEVLSDLDALARAEADEVLTLTEAARQSGYCADHLGRLVRDGVIPNAGRTNAPRIRRRDLPQKATHPLVRTESGSYDVDADARSLASHFQHGGSHGAPD